MAYTGPAHCYLVNRHERYLGMWVEGERFGPGIIVTSNGTYCEATFTNGMAGVSGREE